MSIKAKFHLLALSMILLFSFVAGAQQKKKGQWYGTLDLAGGSNFEKPEIADKGSSHWKTSGGLTFGYKTDKFDSGIFANGDINYQEKNRTALGIVTNGMSVEDIQEESDLSKADLDQMEQSFDEKKLSFGLKAAYKPSERNRFQFKYTHKLERLSNIHQQGGVNLNEADTTFNVIVEYGNRNNWASVSELSWQHKFEKTGRELKADFVFDLQNDSRFTERYSANNSISRFYKITPLYLDNAAKLNVNYSDKDFLDCKDLNVNFGLNTSLKGDRDWYSASYYDFDIEEWRDSTRLRENFNYLAVTADPFAEMDYKAGQFKFKARIVPQMFMDRLNDNEHISRLHNLRVTPLANFNIYWDIAKNHKLELSFERTIKRPDYLQICWFQRPGVYSNEIMQGNEELKPSRSNNVRLSYKYTLNRFSAALAYKNIYEVDIIEQTYNNATIENIDYRIFTWINSGHSDKSELTADLGWAGRIVKARLSAKTTYFKGVNVNEKVTTSWDYVISGFTDIAFAPGWMLSARGKYESDVYRNYTVEKEYIGMDVKLQKSFKHFKVYFEANDLFDKPIVQYTYSEDMTEAQMVSITPYRRIFRLGLNIQL